MFLKKIILANVFLAASITGSYACDIGARVSIVGNEFPAIQTVGAGAQECSGAEVKTNLTADHQKINVAGMQGNPAEFTVVINNNSVLTTMLNEDLVRPLDDLVAKHGQSLMPNQLITACSNQCNPMPWHALQMSLVSILYVSRGKLSRSYLLIMGLRRTHTPCTDANYR